MMQFTRIKPADRPSVKSLFDHPWIADAVKKMQKATVK